MIIYKKKVRRLKHLGWLKFKEAPSLRKKLGYIHTRFTAKNSIKETRFLIKNYSQRGDHICDLMCGLGTSIVEAVRLGRNAYGFDIYQKQVSLTIENAKNVQEQNEDYGSFKVYWHPGEKANELVPTEFFQLVIYSPPYGKQNHPMGKTKNQEQRRKDKCIYSCQEYSLETDAKWRDYDVSLVKTLDDFYERMERIIEAAALLLRPDGYLITILQDYIRKGKPVGLIEQFNSMMRCNLRLYPVGYYTRKLNMSIFKNTQLKRGNNVIGLEHILIYRKGN